MRQAFVSSLLVAAFLSASILAACGGGGGSGLSTLPPAIVVALANSATAIDTSQSDSLTATVKNDPNNKGVKWTITCPSGVTACGGMAKATSASGAADMYNAPSGVSTAETLTVTVTSLSDSSKFTSVQVTVNPTPSLVSPAPSPPPPGSVGQPFSLNLTQYVQGGTLPDTWSIKSGTLPAGLTLDPNTGIVSGIPTTVTSAMHGRVQVSRSGAATAIVVFASADLGNPPVSVNVSVPFTIDPAPPLMITTPALPAGTAGIRYGRPIRCGNFCAAFGAIVGATGGVHPYRWSWSAASNSSIPPGLELRNLFNFGLISGTPTTAGTYNVIVTVRDSEPTPMQAIKNFTITIATPIPSPSPSNSPSPSPSPSTIPTP